MKRLAIAVSVTLVSLGGVSPARGSESLAIHEASRPDGPEARNDLIAGSVNSTTWLSMDVAYLRRVSLAWPGKRILVGADVDMPLLLWGKTGAVDTARVSARAAAETLRVHWFALVVDLQTRLGAQHSVLNTSLGWDFQLTVAPSLAFESWSLSPFVGLRQGISTYVHHGEIVHDAFADRYPDGVSGISGPRDGWIPGGNTRAPFGLAFGVDLSRRVSIFGSASLVWTYSPLGVGMFDAMMLGNWPFFVDLGVSWQF
jgi:hypothetical protein